MSFHELLSKHGWLFSRGSAIVLVATLVASARADVSFTGDVFINQSFVEVGQEGVGTLVIDDGSVLHTSTLEVGEQGIGFVEVTGAGTFLDIDNNTRIGINGIGQLDISNRAVVDVQNSMNLGMNPFGEGRVSVSGLGSVLRVANLVVGTNGRGTVEIADEAIVEVRQSQFEVRTRGTLELRGGRLLINDLLNEGLITGSGRIVLQESNLQNEGRIEAHEGDLLIFASNQGDPGINRRIVAVDGGEIEFQQPITNDSSFTPEDQAEITLRNGLVRFGSLQTNAQPDLFNNSVLAAIGGTNDVYGRVENNEDGDIAVTNDSVLIFHDDVEAMGGVISVFPGSTAIFLEDLTMNEPAILLAQLAGAEENGYGVAEIVGDAMLNGELNVTLSAGFTPQPDDSFQLLTVAGGIDGVFELGDTPDLPDGLQWNLNVGENQVLLSVVPETLTGDYNGDGKVGAADFTVWRDNLGASTLLNRDPHNGGPVDEDDFESWKAHFGESDDGSAAGFVSGSAGVPEPGTVGLLVVAGFVVRRKRRR